MLQHHETFDLALQQLATASDQYALLFQRNQQLQDAADIFYRRIAQRIERGFHHHRADAFIAEQFLQDSSVGMPADQVGAGHARLAGAYRAGQEQVHVVRRILIGGQFSDRLGDGQFFEQCAMFVLHPVGFHQEYQFVGIQCDGGRGGDIFQREVEYLAGRRIAERREQHHFSEFHAVI